MNPFPSTRRLSGWHSLTLGPQPFSEDRAGMEKAFFLPAVRLCAKPVPAEKLLPVSIPKALRRAMAVSLRLWQASCSISRDFALRGRLLPGMDMPMTLNFSMALGHYSRAILFPVRGGLKGLAAAAVHEAFILEAEALASALAAVPAGSGRGKSRPSRGSPAQAAIPSASASRLAAALARAAGVGK